jgi:hypothetical protein
MNDYHAPTTYRKFDESSNGFTKRFIKQSGLSKRYGISKATLTHRITKLGLKTIKRGRDCYLIPQQLELLDELDGFLHDNPGGRIDDFVNPHQSYQTLDEAYEGIREPLNHTVEHLIEIEADTLKRQLDEALVRNIQLQYERDLWVTHAQNAAYEIEALKKQATDLQLVNSSLSTYATNQNIDKQRAEIERDQAKANQLMWQQYAEEMKRQLMNIASKEKDKSQPDNVVQFSNRQHQNII